MFVAMPHPLDIAGAVVMGVSFPKIAFYLYLAAWCAVLLYMLGRMVRCDMQRWRADREERGRGFDVVRRDDRD